MAGGSRSLLMLDDTCKMWVVKFTGTPQHRRTLINELVASRLVVDLGLTLPQVSYISVSDAVARTLNSEFANSGEGSFAYSGGTHFGSRYMGGLLPGLVTDQHFGPATDVVNGAELAGIYVCDVWLNNIDRRQAVFVRNARQRRRRAFWIDHGFCFGGPDWDLNREVSRHGYRDLARCIYPNLAEQLDLWTERVQRLPLIRFHSLIAELPVAWCEGEEKALLFLLEQVFSRRRNLKRLVAEAVERDFGTRLGEL